jgi:DNA-binding NtrC family response regulator
LELECARPLAGPARYRLRGIARVRFQRGPARSAQIEQDVLTVRVPDGWMSADHAELRNEGHCWRLVDLDSKNGSLVRGARATATEVRDGDLLLLGSSFFRFRAALCTDGPALLDAASLPRGPAGLRTLSPAFAELLERVAAVAPSRVPALLWGETGTGKEVLARALHEQSGRRGPFVPVNCGSLPEKLVEAELFGHKRGAFSGADADRPGLVAASSGGTLFLDEIGDLPLPAQVALLRVLQEGEVRPVGATRPIPVDLRAVAATHRDLDALVEAGGFRADLLARLDGVRLDLPPLRDRAEDVPLLIAELLGELAPHRPGISFAPEAAEALLEHRWPLNVRELAQALAGALALSGARPIALEHLPRALRERRPPPREPELDEADRAHKEQLVELLRQHQGNLAAIARALGKGRTQVVRWVRRFGLDPDSFKP